MSSFLKKLLKDFSNYKSWPLVLLMLLLGFLKPLNDLLSIFKSLPLIIILIAIYIAILIAILNVLGKTIQYEKKERKIAKIVLVSVSILMGVYLVGYGFNSYSAYAKSKKLKKELAEENAKRKLKINILTAFFTRDSSDDHFSPQLLVDLSDKLKDSSNVLVEREHSYYEAVSGIEKKIRNAFNLAGTEKGILAYGDYAPAEKRLSFKIYFHNLDSVLSVNNPDKSGNLLSLKLVQNYEIEFGEKVSLASDFIMAALFQRLGKKELSQEVAAGILDNPELSPQIRQLVLQLAGDNSLMGADYSKAISYYNEADQLDPFSSDVGLKSRKLMAYFANSEYSTAKTIAGKLQTDNPNIIGLKTSILENINNCKKCGPDGVVQLQNNYQVKIDNKVLFDSPAQSVEEVGFEGKRYFLIKRKNQYQILSDTGILNGDLFMNKNSVLATLKDRHVEIPL